MRNLISVLLASTALLSHAAWAEEVEVDANTATMADAAGETEIVVFGQGETKQVQEVGARDIAVLLPGTSPIRAIEKMRTKQGIPELAGTDVPDIDELDDEADA